MEKDRILKPEDLIETNLPLEKPKQSEFQKQIESLRIRFEVRKGRKK